MIPEFSGIERRLDELNERLARLEPFKKKQLLDFEEDAYLRDIVERNLEIAIQCCIDISHRIISIEKAQKPRDYYEAIIRMGELGVIPFEFARKLAPIAGFRNILVHEYLSVNWDEVHKQLGEIEDLLNFADLVRKWLRKKDTNNL
jgi:uncharacterized protein YutE (UPF0331/DUF86 family)